MNEPFNKLNPNTYRYKDEDGKEILDLGVTSLLGCPLSAINNVENPLPILPVLNDIFDAGSEAHETIEMLDEGARNILDIEKKMKIMHRSKKYVLTGKLDYHKIWLNGWYVEDLKSSKIGGFYYFLNEYSKSGLGKGYKLQLSMYAYMLYIYTSVYPKYGVIRKIDKECYLNQIQLCDELLPRDEVRMFITTHIVILYLLGAADREKLIAETVAFIKPNGWMCNNCQYRNSIYCDIKKRIKDGE